MLTFLRIAVVTYVLAINVYSFILISLQKKQVDERTKSTIKDAKLFVTGLLGGALGIYVAMFIYSYRLQNLFLMVFMPLLIVLNFYLLIVGFTNNFGFVYDTAVICFFE